MIVGAQDILIYWFGPRPYSVGSLQSRTRLWFGAQAAPEVRPQVDELIRDRFQSTLDAALAGELAAWESSPRRRLALILVLDQFCRHIHRDTPQAFAGDERGLSLAVSGMMVGADAALDPVERIFFYMPLQHAESLDVQDESVAAFRRLCSEAPAELLPVFEDSLKAAEEHRDTIALFGRFPWRNATLGRESRPDELTWLLARQA